MNSDRINEIINFLLGPKCLQYILFALIIIGGCVYFWFGPVMPFNIDNVLTKATALKSSFDNIKNNESQIQDLKDQIQKKEEEKNRNKVVVKDVDVKIYKPKYQGLSVEASAIDFVTNLITTLEKTDNEILDLSYNSNTESVASESVPVGVKTIRFYLEMNSTYTSYYRLMNELFSLPYLVSIKSIKMEPFKENKNKLHVDMIIYFYVK